MRSSFCEHPEVQSLGDAGKNKILRYPGLEGTFAKLRFKNKKKGKKTSHHDPPSVVDKMLTVMSLAVVGLSSDILPLHGLTCDLFLGVKSVQGKKHDLRSPLP
jgi:hypothetical protein